MIYMPILIQELNSYLIPAEVFDNRIEKMELSQSEDYRWYSVRHADAYVDIHVCGRRAIMEMEKHGVSNEELDSTIDFYYQKYNLVKRSENARWWGFYFSPMIEGESKPKIWIRFPDKEKPEWFFIEGYNDKDGLILSPNPRKKSNMRLLHMFDDEFKKITLAYPKTIEYARTEAYRYFEKELEEKRPARSNADKRIGFLVFPPPQYKPGYKTYLDVGPVNRDSL